jgi:Pyruvate/2-oxoacid:ferredoxin oxidoreductase delta subunit
MPLKYLKNVTTLDLNLEKCIGCSMCKTVCPHAVFLIKDAKAHIVDKDACMECGACRENCPVEAIKVKSGVGCASGIIKGIIRGTDPTCDCGDGDQCC